MEINFIFESKPQQILIQTHELKTVVSQLEKKFLIFIFSILKELNHLNNARQGGFNKESN